VAGGKKKFSVAGFPAVAANRPFQPFTWRTGHRKFRRASPTNPVINDSVEPGHPFDATNRLIQLRSIVVDASTESQAATFCRPPPSTNGDLDIGQCYRQAVSAVA